MTRDEAREFAKVVQAYADGKDVQALGTSGNWYAVGEYPSFVPSLGWRIKPEPREFWITVACDSEVWQCDITLAEAERQCNERNAHGQRAPYTVVHVREVMP